MRTARFHAFTYCMRTGFLVDDGSGATEVAGPVGTAVALVVAVERVRGVRSLGVRLEAGAAGLDGAAVGAMAARVVQPLLQQCVPGPWLGHAPAWLCAAARVCHTAVKINEMHTRWKHTLK